jgi:hypothetical protein
MRRRIQKVDWDNETGINTRIYNLTMKEHEFNYSANPTFVNVSGAILTKFKGTNTLPSENELSKTYITSVGLYNAVGECLAVGKLTQPLQKNKNTPISLKMRLDF